MLGHEAVRGDAPDDPDVPIAIWSQDAVWALAERDRIARAWLAWVAGAPVPPPRG